MSMKHNNNPRDIKAIVDFHRKQLELAERTKMEAKKHRIKSNLETWVESLPGNLKAATPKNIPNIGGLQQSLRELKIKAPFNKNIIISSSNNKTSRHIAYSILYAMIQLGEATPLSIKKTNLIEGCANIHGMFDSKRWKDNFFNKNAKVLLVEGVSNDVTSLAPRGEEQFWRELLEFTSDENRIAIIIHNKGDSADNINELTNYDNINSSLIKNSSIVKM